MFSQAAGRAAATFLLAAWCASLSAGCSVLLDFDIEADAGPGDDAGPEGDGAAVDAGDPCQAFEDNNDLAAAADLTPGQYPGLAICPVGDQDYYRFSTPGAVDVTIQITFDNMGGAGDLALQLFNTDGTLRTTADTFADTETIAVLGADGEQLPAGAYPIRVYSEAGVGNEYTLTLTVQ